MALTGLIPIGRTPVDYLTEGTKGFNDIFNRIRQAGLEQQKINDMVNYHKSSIGLQGAAGARAQAMLQPQLQALQDAHMMNELKYNPEAQSNYFQKMMEMISGQSSDMGGQSPVDQGMPNRQGAPGWGGDVGDMQNPDGTWNGGTIENNPMASQQQAPSQTAPKGPNWEALAKNPMARAMLKNAGIDLDFMNKESPQQKQMREVETTRQKEEEKLKVKAQEQARKEKDSAEKDLPHLMTTLENIRELKRIATDKPHLFGKLYPGLSSRFANDEDVGKFNKIIIDTLPATEGKLSQRGNQLALKTALAGKASFGENAKVALGKIKAMEKETIEAIENSRKLIDLGNGHTPSAQTYKDTDMVIVEGPNGEETMTYADAKAKGAM